MDADTLIAMAGLTALGAAALTGAIWDSPLVVGARPAGGQDRGRNTGTKASSPL
ncbi:hypothetical protein [Mycolicibacterium phlei]|jgi:hypothetical protein|uniref:hypothetical protein n=1 Tax=Mycolicibacterium phlei TaxID=1771 RepID=UPI0002D958D0|nr:hypothetical protein [Mycolicibacterium phlei]